MSDFKVSKPNPQVVLKSGSEIRPTAISWLWRGYLARGKVHILAGMPGAGKSTLAFSLAASLSSGRPLPDGSSAHPVKVLIWSAEDDLADTIVPRLMAMGANMENILFITSTDNRPFNPATDMDALSQTLEATPGVGLLVVDPIVSVVTGDGHKATEVRKGLQPLVDLGMKLGIVVLGISHFSKGTVGREPLERVIGSQAFGAVARVVFLAAKREDGQRMFARAKSNIGPDTGGFLYVLINRPSIDGTIEASCVEWGEEIEGNAKELLAEAENESIEKPDTLVLSKAVAFIRTKLMRGEVAALDMEKNAKNENISLYALKKAKADLKVISRKNGLGEWHWRLPDPPSGAWFTAR